MWVKPSKNQACRAASFILSSKIWDTEQGFSKNQLIIKKLNKPLDVLWKRLQTDYLDLYLIHWPNPEKTKATWQAMEDLYNTKILLAL